MDTNTGGYRPSVQAQVQYVVEWFHEWSEMQRGDFLPILAQKFVPANYVNGLVSGMDGLGCKDDRPPSLFQCRVKLFREWAESWGPGEREQLLNRIKAVDADFVTKFEEEVKSASTTQEEKPSTPVTETNESVEPEKISVLPSRELTARKVNDITVGPPGNAWALNHCRMCNKLGHRHRRNLRTVTEIHTQLTNL